jgi:hypothetical protein
VSITLDRFRCRASLVSHMARAGRVKPDPCWQAPVWSRCGSIVWATVRQLPLQGDASTATENRMPTAGRTLPKPLRKCVEGLPPGGQVLNTGQLGRACETSAEVQSDLGATRA